MLYDAGARRWRSFDSWPPKAGAPRNLYLHGGGALTFDPPRAGEASYDQYVSDPAHPVPYRSRPVERTYDARGSRWKFWETEDQRFVDGRPDVVKLGIRAPRGRPVGRRKHQSQHCGLHHRARRRLGGEADRRPSRQRSGQLVAGRIRADGRPRDHARPLSQELQRPGAARAKHAARSSPWICTSRATPSSGATGSWFRSRAPGFRSTTGTRRPGCPTSSRPRRADFRAQTHRIWHTPKLDSRIELTVQP